MIDTAVMQDYLRDANPIAHVDDLDPDELARFVAATRMRRAVALQNQVKTTKGPVRATTTPRRRRIWAFAAGFVLALVVIGAISVLRTHGTAVDVVEEPTPSIDVESLEWTRTPLSEVFGPGAEVAAMTAGGPGIVAVGSVDQDAAVWTSPDALTWTRVHHDPEVFSGYGSLEIADVTVGGPGLVAVGEDEVAAAVWTSPDGFSWSRVTNDTELGGSDDDIREMWSVTAGGPGLVAVGIELVRLEGAWNHSYVGRVWTSPDGFTWTQVPHDPEIFGYADAYETLSSIDQVISGGPGLIAVGVLNGDAAVWSSSNGLVWTPTTQGLTWTSTVFDGGRIGDVTTGGPGLVAVGGYELDPTCKANAPLDCYAAVWTSADGITWEPLPHDDAVLGGGPDKQGMHSITTIGTDLVAVGTSVWTSEDGINWTRRYHDPGFVPGEHSGMRYVFAAGDTLIAFGEAAIDTNYVYIATERAKG